MIVKRDVDVVDERCAQCDAFDPQVISHFNEDMVVYHAIACKHKSFCAYVIGLKCEETK